MPSPSPSARSYGTAAGVAAYARVYTASGSFSTATNPTEATVVAWIDQVSAMVNSALASHGFTVPVTQDDVKLAITGTVEQLVAELCQAANSAGRFFTEKALQAGVSPWVSIRKEVLAWVQANAGGFEQLGASRGVESVEVRIGSRDVDEAGRETSPIFQRRAFGNDPSDWKADGSSEEENG